MTRFVFIGAGAIGSAVGGLLADRGTEVLLVARGEHGRTMIDAGLRLRCPETTIEVRPEVVTGPADVTLRPDDVLVLSTKSHQAEAAVDQWADVPVRDGERTVGRAADLLPIVTALNGVASEDIALRYFDRVYAACVMFPAVMIRPGEVIVRSAPGRGIFHVGRYGGAADRDADRAFLDDLARHWDPAGCHIETPAAVMEWKYRKLLSNLGNVFGALLGETDGADELHKVADAEGRDILAAAGIPYTSDAEDGAIRRRYFTVQPVPGAPEQLGSSTWQSLVRGTGSIETDYLNGEIALIARRIGRRAPVNARLAALARHAARNGLRPGTITVDELRRELDL